MDQQQLEVMQQLHAQVQQQAAQLQQLGQHAAAAGAGVPPVHVPRPNFPRLAAPRPFDGKPESLDSWLIELRRQCAYYHFVTDADQLHMAVAHLNDAVTAWWEHLLVRPVTWAAFVAELRQEYQPVNAAAIAREKLAVITQGKVKVSEYIATFRQLLTDVPTMHADDRLANFLRGLNPTISTQLQLQGVATLEAAIQMATRHSNIGRHVAAAHGAAGVAAAQRAGAPMELDAIEGLEADTGAPMTRAEKMMFELLNAMREERKSPHRGGAGGAGRGGYVPKGLPRISRLTEEQVKEYMEKDMCFHCDKIGHQSRQCPNKKRWGK